VALRREEDAAAAAIVGAEICHFGIPDCIYRRSPEGNLLYIDDVFAPLDPLEAELSTEIAAALAEELRPDDVVICPLTVGGHMDHKLTRAAVEQLQHSVWYYADIPYLLDHPEALEPVLGGLSDESFPVSEKGLAAWLDGVAAYKSQMVMLFETDEKMREEIRAYCLDRRGVRLWHAG
jgi:LmbE family N-acetylglucosaminyl deacetylase